MTIDKVIDTIRDEVMINENIQGEAAIALDEALDILAWNNIIISEFKHLTNNYNRVPTPIEVDKFCTTALKVFLTNYICKQVKEERDESND